MRRERVFSGTIEWKGLEDYTMQDLSADVADAANLNLPLDALGTIRTTGRNDSILELEVATAQGQERFRLFLLSGLYADHLGSGTPVAAGGSMAAIAAAIQQVKTGQG